MLQRDMEVSLWRTGNRNRERERRSGSNHVMNTKSREVADMTVIIAVSRCLDTVQHHVVQYSVTYSTYLLGQVFQLVEVSLCGGYSLFRPQELHL